MACGCRGAAPQVQTSSKSSSTSTSSTLANNGAMEYVVRYGDGSYSTPLPTMQAAFEEAAVTGGQARVRAKVAANA